VLRILQVMPRFLGIILRALKLEGFFCMDFLNQKVREYGVQCTVAEPVETVSGWVRLKK
jgi:hypothetical protein